MEKLCSANSEFGRVYNMLFEKGLRDFTKCQSFCTDNEDNVGALPRHFPENSPANNAENSPVNNA